MLKNLVNGILGNFSEVNLIELKNDYKNFLFDNEEIECGYVLIRDKIVFTNKRIIFIDKQGVSGKKTSFKSIFLDDIVDVEMESAGSFGLDDSELVITYMRNVFQKSNNEILDHIKFEFPKSADITILYRKIGNIVLKNRERINK